MLSAAAIDMTSSVAAPARKAAPAGIISPSGARPRAVIRSRLQVLEHHVWR